MTTRRNGYEEQYNASRIRPPDNIPTSAGGLTKTNWELEIKKRYQQPLFSETIEFPDAAGIFARMVPICYEEAITSGSSMQCAEFVGIASEIFIKDILGGIFNRTRANGPRYENSAGGGILTGTYKKHVAKEEAEVQSNTLSLDRDTGLLPVEAKEAASRRPLHMNDLKLAGSVVRGLWNGMPLIGRQVAEAGLETEQEEWRADRAALEMGLQSLTATNNGPLTANGIHGFVDMDLGDDGDDYGWEGSGAVDNEALNALLEDCLAIRT